MPGHSAQVDTGGRNLAHRGILMFNNKVVAVAQLLGQLHLANVLLIDIGMRRKAAYLIGPKGIPDTKGELCHTYVSSSCYYLRAHHAVRPYSARGLSESILSTRVLGTSSLVRMLAKTSGCPEGSPPRPRPP